MQFCMLQLCVYFNKNCLNHVKLPYHVKFQGMGVFLEHLLIIQLIQKFSEDYSCLGYSAVQSVPEGCIHSCKNLKSSLSSSSSSSCSNQGAGLLVNPFRSHASRSLFSGIPWFLLPFGVSFFYHLG
jgi:hypothetical protein